MQQYDSDLSLPAVLCAQWVFIKEDRMCSETRSAAELKAEPAHLEVIQSKMSTFHIIRTILNVGQGVLPSEKVSKLWK